MLFPGRWYHAVDEGLDIPSNFLDFGNIWEQDTFEWTVPFHNRSRHSITIEKIATSCNCLRVTPASFTLSPEASLPSHLVPISFERRDPVRRLTDIIALF
jgi:hypothetical protein